MAGMSGRGGKNSKAVREFKAAGNKAMQAGAFQKAMRFYNRALEVDAGNPILYSNRSAAHFNLRQFAESLDDAESAILCDATWWKAYKRKGLALIHMQRYEEAIAALEEGLAIVKKNAEMEKNLEFARACQEQAQNLYILPEPHMMQRLESVPVFIVTDNVGQPFFVTYDDGQQVCTFYFDQEDANATLDWIKSENPGLGDTARVIHITLHQAFNLAQETQKQYYEETTRAAAAEDRAAAAAAAASKGVKGAKVLVDVDGDEEDADDSPANSGDGKIAAATEKEVEAIEKEADAAEAKEKPEATAKEDDKESADAAGEKSEEGTAGTKDDNKEDPLREEGAIDENAPLSFQFRPELRQVKVAVELLNKHPNPPVKPILRDPPSVRKAKAEAAAAAAAAATADGAGKKAEPSAQDGQPSAGEKEVESSSAVVKENGDVPDGKTGDDAVNGEEKSDDKKGPGAGEEEDEVLTVDNFNGIPIFQAKGLTLLQKDKQLIPLFFSKWDLEDAWKQLKDSNAMDVPGECEVDVGTLEDVLRRMSESKTDEFQNVFFVPSRESMNVINVKFPLDELAASNAAGSRGIKGRPAVKKANFSKAKQIAARGGTKDEIRAAIREDLEKHAERQRMAEIIAQIEQAGRTGSVGGLGRMAGSSATAGASGTSS
eukprot:GFKZ01008651.1.p1 GENE.GFKZ01008651.1~~GFKZ01008651.1.p1  ORF type:complete len:660 (-),score=184.33 GFKZ01008651.1:594-2573(-)